MTRRDACLLAAGLPILLLASCGGVFESKLAAPQAYVLRLPAPQSPAAQATAGSVLVQRPDAGPGLNTDRIALVRSDRRFDVYAASRWAAPAPDLIESVIVEALRGTGNYQAVFDDAAPFAPQYYLRVTLRRFEADYASDGGGGGAPMVHVVLDCTLGRNRDRQLLASFTAQGSARAEADRLASVVAAFESATAAAVAELLRATGAAIDTEKSGGAKAAASEGR
jgi:cholesterol transport system auxiliary component